MTQKWDQLKCDTIDIPIMASTLVLLKAGFANPLVFLPPVSECEASTSLPNRSTIKSLVSLRGSEELHRNNSFFFTWTLELSSTCGTKKWKHICIMILWHLVSISLFRLCKSRAYRQWENNSNEDYKCFEINFFLFFLFFLNSYR